MKHKKLLFVIAAVVIALCITASAQESVTVVVPVDKDGVQRVTIVSGSYFFKPSHIVVKVNVPVELKVSKEGATPHNIVAASPDAGIAFQQGLSSTPVTIKFTPTKVGKYPFYCSLKAPFAKSHRERGMEGVIEVVQ
jgi:plastocyanin domain-containing protein